MMSPTTELHVFHNGKACKPRFRFGDWIGYHILYAGEISDHHGLIAGIGWCQSTPYLPDRSGYWDGFMHEPGFVYLVHPPKDPVTLFTVFDYQIFAVFSEELAAQHTKQRQQFLEYLQTNPLTK